MEVSMQGKIAYFSAEWGLSDELPIFAGGLGVLAADILKEASDQNFPMIGIGLLYHEGFFKQKIDEGGNQVEENFKIDPQKIGLSETLDPETGQPLLIEVNFPVEPAAVKVWQKQVGNTQLFLLDANIPVNKPFEQNYTAHLYEGAWSPFLEQEVLLGVGGIRLLRTLKLPISKYHLNDDHAAFSILERLRETICQGQTFASACVEIKNQTVFTTHTPVTAAESKFPTDFIWPYLKTLFQLPLSQGLLAKKDLLDLGGVNLSQEEPVTKDFSLSVLALRSSSKINAVSKRHQAISKKIWHFVPIDCVTNAVHPPTWIAKPMDEFYKKYLGEDYQQEMTNPNLWQKLEGGGGQEKLNQDLWQARSKCKVYLKGFSENLKSQPLFLGFARRFAPYKRVYLLISDLDRLSKILTHPDSPVYLFVAGKAHPADPIGKKYLKEIFVASQDPRLQSHLIFLPDYNLDLAKILIPGVDVWLNTPLPPMEASGTSGMKAALNGVLNASVADGWWWEVANAFEVEGSRFKEINNVVEWTIGPSDPPLPEVFGKPDPENDQQTATALYDLLENQVVPLYYEQIDGVPVRWIEKIKKSLIMLAPQFNTQRLLRQYQEKLYF